MTTQIPPVLDDFTFTRQPDGTATVSRGTDTRHLSPPEAIALAATLQYLWTTTAPTQRGDHTPHQAPLAPTPQQAPTSQRPRPAVPGATPATPSSNATHHDEGPRGGASTLAYATSSTGTDTPGAAQATSSPEGDLPPVGPEDIRIAPATTRHVDRLGLTLDDLAEIINDPEEEYPTPSGYSYLLIRGDYAIVVGTERRPRVVAAMRESEARRPPRASGVPRGRGGAGRRYPTTLEEMLTLARRGGADVELRSGGHYGITVEAKTATVPATPSDYRSLLNAAKTAERVLGIDLKR